MTRKHAVVATALAVVLLARATDAAAQPVAAANAAQLDAARALVTLKSADVDLSVPDSPAFTALGLSPETIVRPTSPREFATSLLNGVGQNGHLQTGVAVDAVPYLVYAGNRVTLRDYRNSTVTRILSRTQASFATTKGATEEDKSVRLAAGIHATLFDSEDPRQNNDALLNCYSAIPVFRTQQLPISPDPAARAAQEQQLEREKAAFEQATLRTQVDACRDEFRRSARWNGTSWIVAAATTWTSPTGLVSDLDGGTLGVWTSWSYGFDGVPGLENSAQLIAHLRYIANELVVDKGLPRGREERDTTFAGLRFRAGTSAFGLSFEAAYRRTSAARRQDDTATRLALAAERRLAENLWLTVSVGGDAGADTPDLKGLSVLSAFKWAFAHDPALNPRQADALRAVR